MKGPVKEFTKRLAKKYRVILVNEFCTSLKLWISCRAVLQHPKHPKHEKKKKKKGEKEKILGGRQYGVSYCDKKQCIEAHRMINRDIDAAFKIGARFLAQLGPFGRDVKANDIECWFPFPRLRAMINLP